MKNTMALATGMLAWGGVGNLVAAETVQVYYQCPRNVTVDGPVLAMARERASLLLAEAGVHLDWRRGTPADEMGAQTIVMTFVPAAPASFSRGMLSKALAAARPYGPSSEISVFNDRITSYLASYSQTDRGRLLGHVLAHEIVHILEGVARHSLTGLMMGNWGWRELRATTTYGLHLAEEDRRLVISGLEARRRQATLSAAKSE